MLIALTAISGCYGGLGAMDGGDVATAGVSSSAGGSAVTTGESSTTGTALDTSGSSGGPTTEPEPDECQSVAECQDLYGDQASECVSPETAPAWCDCSGVPCDSMPAPAACTQKPKRDTHPKLILSAEDFSTWADLWTGPPWSEIEYNFNHLDPTWQRPITTKAMAAMVGYVLADAGSIEGKESYRDAILDAIDGLYENEFPNLAPSHGSFTGTAGSTVACLMALDAIYSDPDLSAAARDSARSKLEEIVQWYRDSTHGGWRLARLGLFVAWSIFEGDEDRVAEDLAAYKHELQEVQSFPDGSYVMSPGYFSARLGGRLAKTAAVDIISLSGTDDLYCDEHMAGLMGWASSFWLTPFGAPQMFGDTIFNHSQISGVVTRLGHYDERYGRVGKWLLANNTETGFVPTGYGQPAGYTYGTTHPSFGDWEPQMPSSLLMQDYGASLWGRRDSSEALMGTVHAFGDAVDGKDLGHSHEDTGSIHIAGYGEHLVFNSSVIYVPSYPGTTPAGGSWRDAYQQNSVLIGDRTTHDTMYGRGLAAGLTGGSVEFGKVDSGDALGNGQHFRSLFLVHDTPEQANGYFVIVDEVKPDQADDPIRVNLHLNSSNIAEVTAGQEYRGPIDFVLQDSSDGTEAISIMYGTPPSEVSRQPGFHADGVEGRELEYLEAVYSAGDDGWLRALTVLFPEDGQNGKAQMQRLSEDTFTGVLVDHGVNRAGVAVADVFVTMNASDIGSRDGVSFQGTSVFYRNEGQSITQYVVTDGLFFDDGQADRTGFRSDQSVHVQIDGDQGYIESAGTLVTFYAPGLTRVLVDGKAVGSSVRAPGSVTATIPAGRRALTLEF